VVDVVVVVDVTGAVGRGTGAVALDVAADGGMAGGPTGWVAR
jgi:hypothetical protein